MLICTNAQHSWMHLLNIFYRPLLFVVGFSWNCHLVQCYPLIGSTPSHFCLASIVKWIPASNTEVVWKVLVTIANSCDAQISTILYHEPEAMLPNEFRISDQKIVGRVEYSSISLYFAVITVDYRLYRLQTCAKCACGLWNSLRTFVVFAPPPSLLCIHICPWGP